MLRIISLTVPATARFWKLPSNFLQLAPSVSRGIKVKWNTAAFGSKNCPDNPKKPQQTILAVLIETKLARAK